MIDSLSAVHPKAHLGKFVSVGPFSVIENDVVIGDGTWIGSNVNIMSGARIGKNCRIFPGAVIAAIPQDLKYEGEETTVVIGDNTTIRECVTINRGTKARGVTEIGNNCLLMAYTHVAHDCVVGNNCILANGATLAGHIVIGDYAILGGLTAVHQFVNIGRHAMLSGGSLVGKDVPPYTKAARRPLSYAGVNSIGLRRRGYDNKTISHIQDIYRILYLDKYNTAQALEIIEAEIPVTEERDEIISFINGSQRGIMKKYSRNGRE